LAHWFWVQAVYPLPEQNALALHKFQANGR